MVNLLVFVLAVGVMVAFIPVFVTFINLSQQSNFLNCAGYIHNGNAANPLSFNSTLNGGESGSPLSCIAIRMYLPYLLMVFLIAGVAKLLYNQTSDYLTGGPSPYQ